MIVRQFLKRICGPPLVLGIIAVALLLPGFWWGAPHATAADRKGSWGVDDASPLGPLADVHNIIQPKPDRRFGYPLMHSFVLSVAYAPYLGYLRLMGKFVTGSAKYPFGMADPVRTLRVLTLIAHFVSVLMGVGIVLAAYDAGRTLCDRHTGILAALFAMISFPMFYYSRTANVDVPVLFYTALALAAYARIIAAGFTTQRAIWLGVFVGFALATKEPSFASFLALPIVLLALHWRNNKSGAEWFSWRFWQAPLAALLAAFLAFGVASGLFVDPKWYFAHVGVVRSLVRDMSAGRIEFMAYYPYTWQGNLQLARVIGGYLIDAMTLPGLLLAVLGILWTLRREALTAAFALPAFTYLMVLFGSARNAQLRYVMPVAFTLVFFSARAVTLAWGSRRSFIRASFAVLAFGIITLGLLRGVDLTYAMINDSRYGAAAWLESRTKSGDRLAFFGDGANLPALKYGVTTECTVTYRGAAFRSRIDQEAVQEIETKWREEKPDFILISPDLSSPPNVPYNASCPPAVYEGLLDGSLGYRLAAYLETPKLFPWVRRPALDYPSVNPPIRIFARATQSGDLAKVHTEVTQ